MFCSLRLLAVLLILTFTGCRQSAPPSRAIERLAVLPFENLTGDRSFDWLSRGAQVALNRQLAPSRTVAISAYPNVADAALGRATRLLHTNVEMRSGLLHLEAMLEDASTHRQVGDRIELRVSPEQILTGLNQLAQRLASDASPAAWQRPDALAAYVEGQAAPPPEAKAALPLEAKAAALSRAAQLDPQFALPLISLAELHLAAGRRDEALAALNAAAARPLHPVEQQQIALLKANLTQDRAQQAQALQQLSAAAPTQANLQIFAATLLQSLRQLGPAVTAYERAVKVDPDNADIWNRLGYANAYLGRLPAARQALERFQQLEPDNANALDSQGEVHYLNSDFKQAAAFFQASFVKSPQFEAGRASLKAAYAHLLDGRFDAADEAADRYAKAAGNSPAAQVARAHYLFADGQPDAALKLLSDAAAPAQGPLASLYHSHRCGLLLRHDRTQAHAAARAAMAASASGPAVLCFFVSQPSVSPAEWSARANQTFAAPNAQAFRRQALAYALYFDGHFSDALPLIEQLALDTGPDTDSEVRVWLAECQWRTGRWPAARETLARWPLPASDSIFSARHLTVNVLSILKTGQHFDDNSVAKRWSGIGAHLGDSLE